MNEVMPGLIAMFFSILLALLVVALVFSNNFRAALLGGRGEASVFDVIKVKGVAIVLLVGILVGGILKALSSIPQTSGPQRPVAMRFSVHFDPNDVNPRNPNFKVAGFKKTNDGVEPIKVFPTVSEGALIVHLTVPDMNTPFFLVFDTPKGIWKTDDHSVLEAATTARKQEQD